MVRNLQRVLARLRAIPQKVKDNVAQQLAIEGEHLVDDMKRAAPVGGTKDEHPGRFRDSIHFRVGRRPLSILVIADAKDDQGNGIALPIEFGHRTKEGTHVPGRPSFFVTYRSRKASIRRRLKAAAQVALNQET